MSSANNSSINGRIFFTESHLQIQSTHMHLCYMQIKIVTFFFCHRQYSNKCLQKWISKIGWGFTCQSLITQSVLMISITFPNTVGLSFFGAAIIVGPSAQWKSVVFYSATVTTLYTNYLNFPNCAHSTNKTRNLWTHLWTHLCLLNNIYCYSYNLSFLFFSFPGCILVFIVVQ